MAGKKFLRNVAGVVTEVLGIQTSAGAGNAGDIPALDSTGRLDTTLMPVGVVAETDIMPSSENLAAGDFVNIWTNTGVANARKADGSTSGKEANGFVLASVTAPANATVYRLSQSNTQKTGMTPGAEQFLSVTIPGGTQEAAPTTAGQVCQMLGKAINATTLNVSFKPPIVLS